MEEATRHSSWGEMLCACSQVVSRQNVVRGDDLKVGPTECTAKVTQLIKKESNGTEAKVFFFQTLNDKISQLFSPLTSLAHQGCFVEF